MSNAIKFTPENGRISVIVKRSSNQVKLYVSDSGQGITKEFLPFIFERFRQADSSRPGANGGLGLGLSLFASSICTVGPSRPTAVEKYGLDVCCHIAAGCRATRLYKDA